MECRGYALHFVVWGSSILGWSEQGFAQAILRGVIDFKRDPWPNISDSAKSLVKAMLEPDPKLRLIAKQVLGALNIIFMMPIFLNHCQFWLPYGYICLICRASMAAKCQKSSKCSARRCCQIKA
ncbi:unnamed protein product [Linum tenue]|uniref:Uncharacterized protein n=1 Tax=Linum tenue TaxID=586396 RepID=A0AAV0Q5S2_9ROSI|nr:unnamed protein product [Linum tenue]